MFGVMFLAGPPGIDTPLDSDVFASPPRDHPARGRSAATPTSNANEGARRFHQSIARRSPLARRTPGRSHPDHRVARHPRGLTSPRPTTARRGRCAPARSTAKSPTAFAANGAPRSTPISDPSSKPHGEDRSEPSTQSASPSKAAPCLAQLENVNGDLSNYLCRTFAQRTNASEFAFRGEPPQRFPD